MTNYDTRLFDEINQSEPDKLSFGKSYDLMIEINSLMNQYKSNAQMNANLGIKDNLPDQALATIKNFAANSAVLNGLSFDLSNANAASYVAYDLARAATSIEPHTPELSKELLTTAKSLFEKTEGIAPTSQIEELTKVCRYTGDKEVATAFLNSTQNLFENMDGFYKSYVVSDYTLGALKNYKDIATLHPELAERCLNTADILAAKIEEGYNKRPLMDIMQAVADNPNVAQDIRDKAKDLMEKYQPTPKQENRIQMVSEEKRGVSPKKQIDKQTAHDFIKKSKAYAGGKKLFERVKNAINETLDKNPKLATAAGLAVMIAGCQTLRPEMAAAGAAIMIEGLHHLKHKMLERRGLATSRNEVNVKPTGLKLDMVHAKGLKYDR